MISYWFHITAIVTVVGAIVIGATIAAYDFWMLSKGPGATISYVIWTYSQKYPIIPAMIGFTFGLLGGYVECPVSAIM